MVRPRGHGHLAADMAALRGAGADIVVCALPDAERAELGLADEPRLAEAAGLRFVALPIPDFTVPSIPVVLAALRGLAAELWTGAHVVAHCRCAIGRPSLIAVSLMILEGIAPDAAWAAMERARATRCLTPRSSTRGRWSSSASSLRRTAPRPGPRGRAAGTSIPGGPSASVGPVVADLVTAVGRGAPGVSRRYRRRARRFGPPRAAGHRPAARCSVARSGRPQGRSLGRQAAESSEPWGARPTTSAAVPNPDGRGQRSGRDDRRDDQDGDRGGAGVTGAVPRPPG
ncbi:hypothetical protein [Streptomyces sp. NL15-2K]|uniref:phosphatase domain-containing putative toxin n=1 Tax=Streptomyces sp. NL15-2K TaxID=376149 RepID=UPI001C0F108F|nr:MULTISPECIES: hypothetical protein [Actinomycetes]WKX15815.1 hypothetical protein Q4V64_53320 [Kutzneria buriramensis]